MKACHLGSRDAQSKGKQLLRRICKRSERKTMRALGKRLREDAPRRSGAGWAS